MSKSTTAATAPNQQLSNLQRLDQELAALSVQTERLQGMTEMVDLLKSRAEVQDQLAQRLETLERNSANYLAEARALRGQLEATTGEASDTSKLTHERVQAYGGQVSDLKVDVTQRMSDLRADIRETLETKLDGNAARLQAALAADAATSKEELKALESRVDAKLRMLRGLQIGILMLLIIGLGTLAVLVVLR